MTGEPIRRREFITLLGGAAASWPVGAGAQQAGMPVIGFLSSSTAAPLVARIAAFRRGLAEVGFVEGHNVAIEYRFADLQNDRLPALAADLVRRNVNVIAGVNSTAAALAAKAATTSIPIVFAIGGDPVKFGLVASLNRPGGNLTGVSFLTNELGPKRLGLLRDLLPNAGLIAALVNPTNPNAESDANDLLAAAQSTGMTLNVLQASDEREIDAFFATLVQRRASAFLTMADPLFSARRQQFAVLAAYHKIPAIYPAGEFTDAGGLMSYAPNVNDAYRQGGVYTGRILKGEKLADLPVMQPTKFEFVINLQTARLMRIEIPPTLLALTDAAFADEVIE
jgi:putative tryptophan/tyrosine transport system substrate-binding protein